MLYCCMFADSKKKKKKILSDMILKQKMPVVLRLKNSLGTDYLLFLNPCPAE